MFQANKWECPRNILKRKAGEPFGFFVDITKKFESRASGFLFVSTSY
jgi:hypothetical protein